MTIFVCRVCELRKSFANLYSLKDCFELAKSALKMLSLLVPFLCSVLIKAPYGSMDIQVAFGSFFNETTDNRPQTMAESGTKMISQILGQWSSVNGPYLSK